MGGSRTGERRYRPPEGVRLLFIGLLGMWLLIPFLIRDNLAQDALPYVVAGELVRTDPGAIYHTDSQDLYDLEGPFAARSCELSPPGTDCAGSNVAFVSPPQALPFAFVIARLGPSGGILALRLLAAGALAGGMAALWFRLAHRSPQAGLLLVVTTVLLTPFAMVPLPLGQTSPYLFLSACVGVAVTSERRRWPLWLVGALWALTISLKIFPIALVVVLVWQRRWRLVGVAAALLVLLTGAALLLGAPSFGDFAAASGAVAGGSLSNPYNGSFDAVVHDVWPGAADSTVATGALLALRAVVVGGVAWWRIRRADDDTQWAWSWLALLLFVPLVWSHYLWLGIAAVGIVLAGRRRLDDRGLAVLPGVAAASLLVSIPAASSSASPVLQLAFLVGALVVATCLVDRPARSPAAATTPAADPVI